MDGFSNVDPREQGNPAEGATTTVSFDPERAKQLEVGTKLNLVKDRVSASLSYYDIKVSNIVMEDMDRPFYYVQEGEQYSRGFEASITATPVDGLNVIAGYSYNESELEESGLRPETAGPKNLANLWASYSFAGNLDGFGLGFGGNYAGENMIFNRNLGTFTLSSYTVLNAAVFYNAEKFSVNLKLNNLTDEEYYNGWSTINPQTPRNFAASFTYKF
jgi:iron complex outermembrane receptor protein